MASKNEDQQYLVTNLLDMYGFERENWLKSPENWSIKYKNKTVI